MKTQLAHVLLAGLVLAVFALIGSSLLAVTAEATRERIVENQRLALLENLHAVIPAASIDNQLFADTLSFRDPELLGREEPVTVYRGRRQGGPVAVALSVDARDGYNGRIRLLVGIHRDGEITGVRVLEHHETPGLGDYIELDKSDWVLGFDGRSLADPGTRQGWRVRRDGGQFEQFTGATITPRAVVNAVYNSLRFAAEHREQLFPAKVPPAQQAAPPGQPTESSEQ